MNIFRFCSGWLVVTGLFSHFAYGNPVLSVDEVNLLKIERRKLVEERALAVESLVTNEKKIEILLAWANGENPNVIQDRVVPSATAAVSGAIGSKATVAKPVANWITRLPVKFQKWVRRSPALAGIMAAAYLAHDSIEYNSLVNEVHLTVSSSNQEAYYRELLNTRNILADDIMKLGLQINALNNTLSPYSHKTPTSPKSN